MTAAPPTHTDLKSTLEEMRASVAAEGARKGFTGAILEAFLGILSVLLAMLEDFRAGEFARPAPAAVEAGDGAVAYPSPRPSPSGPIALGAMGARIRGERGKGARSLPWRGGFDTADADWAAEDTPVLIADQQANGMAGAKGAAARDAGREGEDLRREAYPPALLSAFLRALRGLQC